MHIGQQIRDTLDAMPGRHSVAWFARQIPCDRSTAYDIFRRSDLDTHLLRKISIILNHNFFADLAEDISDNFVPYI